MLGFPFLCAGLLTAQSTARITLDGASGELAAGGAWGALSGDGRIAAFVSADGVLPGDNNGANDVFVRELATGIVRRVSITAAGVQPNDHCHQPVLSHDGRYVAFSSFASNLAASDINGNDTDVFVKDMVTGVLEHVSVNSAGVGGNGLSAYHDMSADGRCVTFYSYATNLVPGDTDGSSDTFLFDRQTGQIECLSVDPVTGTPAGGGKASLSGDGRIVAFETWAPLFGAPTATIAVLDRQTGIARPVATSLAGLPVVCADPDVSADGSTVVFTTQFQLTPADQDFGRDVYAYDVAGIGVTLVSGAPLAGSAAASCYARGVSGDGRYVVFTAEVPFVAADTNGTFDSYLVDRVSGGLELVTIGDAGEIGDDLSSVVGIDRIGRRLVFNSSATNLVPGDTNGTTDVFVRDRCPAASWTAYGAGFPGSGGVVPGFALLGEPAIGTTPSLVLANQTGAPTIGLLVLGVAPASLPTPVLGALLVDPLVASLIAAPVPALLLPVPIPNVFELCGSVLYLQALVLDGGAAAGVAFTRGIEATIGG
ncbi:MAG TPA: hypothetical protein VFZ65_10555 [Planctomycetota bacterium]|nr:hypothetical protein [Planctomycetota bacterium]